jgi:hypothetical protein
VNISEIRHTGLTRAFFLLVKSIRDESLRGAEPMLGGERVVQITATDSHCTMYTTRRKGVCFVDVHYLCICMFKNMLERHSVCTNTLPLVSF